MTTPTWVARNAKFLWAVAGLILTVATDVVNGSVGVVPAAWLPAIQGVILALTAIGVQRETNAVGIEEVVQLVQHVLPGHQLVALPTASAVLKTAEPVVADVPVAPMVTPLPVSDLSAAMDAALAGTHAAAPVVPPVS